MTTMIRELVIKELRDHMLTLRLQLGFALTLTLIVTSAFVLAGTYDAQRLELTQAARAEDEFARQFSHLNRILGVLRARPSPSPLVLVGGLPRDIGVETLHADPMRELFAPLDLTAVVGFLLSLLGIVLGFDAVSGEKERGTLRQMLANRLERSHVVLAKWIAGCGVMALVVIGAALAAGLVMSLRMGAAWTATDWAAFALVTAVAAVYCAVFFTLGLSASVLTRSSAVSVLVALFTWVIFVLVVPSLSPYVAAQIVPLPAIAALERDFQHITSEERDEIGRREQDRVWQRYPDLQFALGDVAPDDIKVRVAADPDLRARYEMLRDEVEAVWRKVNEEQGRKANRLLADYHARTERQLAISTMLAATSPLPSMTFALTELADSGLESRKRIERQVEEHGRTLRDYLFERYREERRRHPTLSVNDFLDISSRPRFSYRPPALGERLAAALPHVGLLFGWLGLFLAVAVVAFLRYDVR